MSSLTKYIQRKKETKVKRRRKIMAVSMVAMAIKTLRMMRMRKTMTTIFSRRMMVSSMISLMRRVSLLERIFF